MVTDYRKKILSLSTCNHIIHPASNKKMVEHRDLYDIEQVLLGNTHAFEPLVNRHQHNVFNIIYRIVQHQQEAEEVAQDVFVKAFQALSSFNQKSKFSTWMYRIAYNAAISHQRKKKVIALPLQDEVLEYTEEDFFSDYEDTHVLKQHYLPKALEQLSGESQLLISMYYQQDLSISEMSEITEMTASNIKVKLYRARKSLHDYISEMLQPQKQTKP